MALAAIRRSSHDETLARNNKITSVRREANLSFAQFLNLLKDSFSPLSFPVDVENLLLFLNEVPGHHLLT
jgi:hypothetical protein